MDRYLHYKQLARRAYTSRKTKGPQCASEDTFRNRRKRAGIASVIQSVTANSSHQGEHYRAQPMLFPEHKSYGRENSGSGIRDGVREFAIVNNLARSVTLSFDFDGRNGKFRRVKTENGKNMQCPL